MQTAVFLDRDNTLIHNDGDLGRPEEVRLVDGVAAGLKALRDAGHTLVVVTNQAGVARGKFTEDDVDAVHQRLAAMLDEQAGASGLIDRFYYCPYHPEGTVAEYRRDHLWRKPHPGMILQAARDVGIDLARSWMIGDQERDVQAGRSAGCRTILLNKDTEIAKRVSPTAVAGSFPEAVRQILQAGHPSGTAPANGGPPNESRVLPLELPHSPQSPSSMMTGEGSAINGLESLRHSINDLADEVRSDRMRRADFTLVRMMAGLCQLLAVLLALLGLLHLSNTDAFLKWMTGAALVQMLVITALVLDVKS